MYDDPQAVQVVAALPMGTQGFAHNFPAVAVLIGKLEAYPHERDRHLIYIDTSLAAMSFMLALETVGLSSCPINWPDIPDREEAVASLLRLNASERPVMFIAIGYPDPEGLIPYSAKLSLDELRSYNQLPTAHTETQIEPCCTT